MTSLGPDWCHDNLVSVLWHTWFAASAQPILPWMGHSCQRFSQQCFGFHVTVCMHLLFTRSWTRNLLQYLQRRELWNALGTAENDMFSFYITHISGFSSSQYEGYFSPPSTAVTASLYTSSYILAASHQAHIYVKPRIIQSSALNKI